MATNPVQVRLPAITQAEITATSIADYFQIVEITQGGQFIGKLNDTGENIPITTSDDSTSISLAATPNPTVFNLFFRYIMGTGSVPRPATAEAPVILAKSCFTFIAITSEDVTENDANDTYLTIMCYEIFVNPGASPPPNRDAAPATYLNLHSKTYYSTPGGSGDEEYIDIDVSTESGSQYPASATALGWRTASVIAADDRESNPLFNYVAVAATYADHQSPLLAGTYCVATCYLRYLLSPPTGLQTANWSARLYGSLYRLTKITN